MLQTRSGWASASSRNGQWLKAMVMSVAVVDPGGVEAQVLELAFEGVGAWHGPAGPCLGGPTLLAAGIDEVVGVDAAGRRSRQEDPGEQREHGRFEPEAGGIGGDGVAVLGAADRAGGRGGHLDQTEVAHPFEVRSHGVGVQVERLGDLGRGERSGRSRQLEVDGVAGVVAEGLEDLEARRIPGCQHVGCSGIVLDGHHGES